MADITLNGSGLLSSTCVPNIFIDKYMTSANGEYIKIYLYLLRCMDQNMCDDIAMERHACRLSHGEACVQT